MNQLQLYINDQLVDLSDDSPIALTFQINNLAEVKNQQGNTSNQFKLPLTQRNRQILGFPDDIAFTTGLPYDNYQAKIVQDGLEIIPYGLAVLNGIEQDSANITVLSGNVDFFDALDGKIYDMGDSSSQWTNYGQNLAWKEYDHEWGLNEIVTSQTKQDGWIWPVIDYGFITPDFDKPIDIFTMRPGFFIKTAIDLMIKNTGYKARGSLLQNKLYPKLICQFANDNFEHGTDYQNSTEGTGKAASLLYVTSEQITIDGGQLGMHANSHTDETRPIGFAEYHATTKRVKGTASVIFDMDMHGIANTGDNGYFELYIDYRDANGNASHAETLTVNFTDKAYPAGARERTENFKNLKVTHEFDLAEGDSIFISFHLHRYNTTVFIHKGATFRFDVDQKQLLYGQKVQCERIFPDISQKDLLKDVLQRFGIVCQTDNSKRIVSFNSFADIVANIPIAKNWTGKTLNQGKAISFQLGGYAQVNNMKHKEDDNVLPKNFADAQIKVADKTLPASADLFESQFAPSLNTPYTGGSVAQIKKADPDADANDFTISTSPRILIDQKLDLRSLKNYPTVKFTDGEKTAEVNDIISVPYFYKPDGEYNLCFADKPGTGGKTLPGLKSNYYRELEKILTRTKKVVRYFLLNPRDILELDLLVPVYIEQDGCYYYINKIDSWRAGQPTKVELVKMG
ncbi:hypothetical protein [Mucilaginibacter celer]|uniref:Uncharacterized protein n=1 Tax=Mucilaginibacter celer TaxID=2305508 RepID=A0A494VY48_9SPHI|nr:hypothetical protein [Mucilaginibacter celer]AYL96413.1 hypothetical protein HYN43_014390 [Mucilaginibacter celer]